MKNKVSRTFRSKQGFSIVELLVVLLIISILAVFASLAFTSKEMYEADDQTLLILDVLKEAREKAINQREAMRVEIGRNDRTVYIIDENNPGDASDDVIIKTVSLGGKGEIVFDAVPKNASKKPKESTPVPTLSFKNKVHPLSTSNKVGTIRFLLNGNITDAGSTATAADAVVKGATIYVWKPKINPDKTISDNGEIIRAITILGASGNARYWKCMIVDNDCSQWIK